MYQEFGHHDGGEQGQLSTGPDCPMLVGQGTAHLLHSLLCPETLLLVLALLVGQC